MSAKMKQTCIFEWQKAQRCQRASTAANVENRNGRRNTITKSIAIPKSEAKSAMQIVEIMGLLLLQMNKNKS